MASGAGTCTPNSRTNKRVSLYVEAIPTPAPTPMPTQWAGCDETLRGGRDADYRGCQTKTRSGKTCQTWTAQTPHGHSRTPNNYPGYGLGDHNYCRNPDGQVSIWCYTMTSTRWELCNPLKVLTSWTFAVVTNDHGSGVHGMYFNFKWPTGLPTKFSQLVLYVRQCRQKNSVWTGEVIIWNNKAGGTGDTDSHGRRYSGAASGQWAIGDKVTTHGSCDPAVSFEYLLKSPWSAGKSSNCPTLGCTTMSNGGPSGLATCKAKCSNTDQCDTINFVPHGANGAKGVGSCCLAKCSGSGEMLVTTLKGADVYAKQAARMDQPGELGYGLSGNYIVNWDLSEKFSQSSSFCGVQPAARDVTYKTGNTPAAEKWTPYVRFGFLASGASNACNGDKGVSFAKHFGSTSAVGNAFAKARIFNAGAAKTLQLRVGAGQGFIAWLNGIEVRPGTGSGYSTDAHRNACHCYADNQYNIQITLADGWNVLVLKVGSNHANQWGMVVQLSDTTSLRCDTGTGTSDDIYIRED